MNLVKRLAIPDLPKAPIKSKLQHPPPRANPAHFTIFCARGVGNLTFACVEWGKLNRKCQVSNEFFFFWAPKLLTVINHVFRRDKEFKGRDVAFVSDWLTKKVFKRSLLKTGGADDNCSVVGNDRQIGRLGWAF